MLRFGGTEASKRGNDVPAIPLNCQQNSCNAAGRTSTVMGAFPIISPSRFSGSQPSDSIRNEAT